MFRLNLTVEVNQVGNAVAIQTPVPLQLCYGEGRWSAECQTPPVSTEEYDRMEDAVIAGAEAATMELQSLVDDRPVIAGRITPADLPAEWF